MGYTVDTVHLGLGLIGSTALEILRRQRAGWERRFGLSLRHRAFIDTSGAVACDERGGYSDTTIDRILAARAAGTKVFAAAPGIGLTPRTVDEALAIAGGFGPCVVIDCASSAATGAAGAWAIEQGGGAVYSNKAPLALPVSDATTSTLWEEAASGRLRYETTCGAGLPVIATLRGLLDSGDEVLEVSGALSGTLGAIFADLAVGVPFGQAVLAAMERGYTEPDPRDDLSGLDVARKALILARTIGMQVDLDDIAVESLVPEELAAVPVDELLSRVSMADAAIAARSDEARATGGTLKYLARVSPGDSVTVGIRTVPGDTILGSLQGPENIITIRTRRYDAYPLTVTGPGAGAQVTAAGVVTDVLSLARQLKEE
jgi:homoserine dehydrogenase